MTHDKMKGTPAPPADGRDEVEPIPGEHDRSTAAPTPPAIVGTTGYGVDSPPAEDATADEQTKREFRWEGGGKTSHRKRGE